MNVDEVGGAAGSCEIYRRRFTAVFNCLTTFGGLIIGGAGLIGILGIWFSSWHPSVLVFGIPALLISAFMIWWTTLWWMDLIGPHGHSKGIVFTERLYDESYLNTLTLEDIQFRVPEEAFFRFKSFEERLPKGLLVGADVEYFPRTESALSIRLIPMSISEVNVNWLPAWVKPGSQSREAAVE